MAMRKFNFAYNYFICRVSITFIDRDGDKAIVEANVGDSLLDVAKDHDIDLEGI